MKNFSKKIKGLTLIEMLMAIGIFTMGIAGFTLLFLKTWESNSLILETGKSSMTASQGMNKMVEYIRKAKQADDGAYPLKLADENELILYSDYDSDGKTERLHFYKSGTDILMGVTDPTETLPKTYPSDDQQIITIISDVINDISKPIFSYYNQNYPADTENNPLDTPVIDKLSGIRLLKIYLEINSNPSHNPNNIKMESFVEIRNLNDYDRIE